MSSAFAVTRFIAETLAAYRQWAPSYPPVAHNPLMRAEEAAMHQCWPDVAGRRVLDLACGTGRYTQVIADGQPAELVAVDFCEPMLAQVTAGRRVRASMMHLPFGNGVFDVIVCGLAIGHTTDVGAWMTEITRVLAPEGVLLYSDFHPAAARAGLPRTFKDQGDVARVVPHCGHELERQREAAAAAGLTIEEVREIRVGIELTESFAQSASFYRRWHGLPLVLVVRVRK
jgi:ubiquinone/menaquinone biosynthesis C-methylase UbiE